MLGTRYLDGDVEIGHLPVLPTYLITPREQISKLLILRSNLHERRDFIGKVRICFPYLINATEAHLPKKG